MNLSCDRSGSDRCNKELGVNRPQPQQSRGERNAAPNDIQGERSSADGCNAPANGSAKKCIERVFDSAGKCKPYYYAHAVDYITAIKKSLGVALYRRFIKSLYTYRQGQRSIKDFLDDVALLLADHPSLLKEFSFFLPTNAEGIRAKAHLNEAVRMSEWRARARGDNQRVRALINAAISQRESCEQTHQQPHNCLHQATSGKKRDVLLPHKLIRKKENTKTRKIDAIEALECIGCPIMLSEYLRSSNIVFTANAVSLLEKFAAHSTCTIIHEAMRDHMNTDFSRTKKRKISIDAVEALECFGYSVMLAEHWRSSNTVVTANAVSMLEKSAANSTCVIIHDVTKEHESAKKACRRIHHNTTRVMGSVLQRRGQEPEDQVSMDLPQTSPQGLMSWRSGRTDGTSRELVAPVKATMAEKDDDGKLVEIEKVIGSKEAEIASLKTQVASKDEQISLRDELIGLLKEHNASLESCPDNQRYIASVKRKIDSLEASLDAMDKPEKEEPSRKRCSREDDVASTDHKNPSELSDTEVARFCRMVAMYFAAKSEHVTGEVKINVESSSSVGCSFVLQDFFDDLHTQPCTSRIRRILFGTIGQKQSHSLSKAVLSRWTVRYKKRESYEFNSKQEAKGE